jgi:hypothetical protein
VARADRGLTSDNVNMLHDQVIARFVWRPRTHKQIVSLCPLPLSGSHLHAVRSWKHLLWAGMRAGSPALQAKEDACPLSIPPPRPGAARRALPPISRPTPARDGSGSGVIAARINAPPVGATAVVADATCSFAANFLPLLRKTRLCLLSISQSSPSHPTLSKRRFPFPSYRVAGKRKRETPEAGAIFLRICETGNTRETCRQPSNSLCRD